MKFIAFTRDFEHIFEAENITDARHKVINSLDMSLIWNIRELKEHITIKQEIAAYQQKIAACKAKIKQLKKKLECGK